jgi:hypothetical protein
MNLKGIHHLNFGVEEERREWEEDEASKNPLTWERREKGRMGREELMNGQKGEEGKI